MPAATPAAESASPDGSFNGSFNGSFQGTTDDGADSADEQRRWRAWEGSAKRALRLPPHARLAAFAFGESVL